MGILQPMRPGRTSMLIFKPFRSSIQHLAWPSRSSKLNHTPYIIYIIHYIIYIMLSYSYSKSVYISCICVYTHVTCIYLYISIQWWFNRWASLAPTMGLTVFLSFLPTVLLLVIDNCYELRSSSRAQEMLLRWYFWFQVGPYI